MLIGSLVFNNKAAFYIAVEKLKHFDSRYEAHNFNHERKRTDLKMRESLEFCIHASIITCNEHMCRETLVYGRKNTFMICVKQEWLSKALDHIYMYQDQGIAPELLLVLIGHSSENNKVY